MAALISSSSSSSCSSSVVSLSDSIASSSSSSNGSRLQRLVSKLHRSSQRNGHGDDSDNDNDPLSLASDIDDIPLRKPVFESRFMRELEQASNPADRTLNTNSPTSPNGFASPPRPPLGMSYSSPAAVLSSFLPSSPKSSSASTSTSPSILQHRKTASLLVRGSAVTPSPPKRIALSSSLTRHGQDPPGPALESDRSKSKHATFLSNDVPDDDDNNNYNDQRPPTVPHRPALGARILSSEGIPSYTTKSTPSVTRGLPSSSASVMTTTSSASHTATAISSGLSESSKRFRSAFRLNKSRGAEGQAPGTGGPLPRRAMRVPISARMEDGKEKEEEEQEEREAMKDAAGSAETSGSKHQKKLTALMTSSFRSA